MLLISAALPPPLKAVEQLVVSTVTRFELEVGRTSDPNRKVEFWVSVIGAAMVVVPLVLTVAVLFCAHAGVTRPLSIAIAMQDFFDQCMCVSSRAGQLPLQIQNVAALKAATYGPEAVRLIPTTSGPDLLTAKEFNGNITIGNQCDSAAAVPFRGTKSVGAAEPRTRRKSRNGQWQCNAGRSVADRDARAIAAVRTLAFIRQRYVSPLERCRRFFPRSVAAPVSSSVSSSISPAAIFKTLTARVTTASLRVHL